MEKILSEYADFIDTDQQVQVELVFDRERVGLCPAVGIATYW